jgi:hypothetical protein
MGRRTVLPLPNGFSVELVDFLNGELQGQAMLVTAFNPWDEVILLFGSSDKSRSVTTVESATELGLLIAEAAEHAQAFAPA